MASSPTSSATPLTTSITSSTSRSEDNKGEDGKAGQASPAAVRHSAAPALARSMQHDLSAEASSAESPAQRPADSSSTSSSGATLPMDDQEEVLSSIAAGKAGTARPRASSNAPSSGPSLSWVDDLFSGKADDTAKAQDENADKVDKVPFKAPGAAVAIGLVSSSSVIGGSSSDPAGGIANKVKGEEGIARGVGDKTAHSREQGIAQQSTPNTKGAEGIAQNVQGTCYHRLPTNHERQVTLKTLCIHAFGSY